jgi:hypothetical protein
LKTTAVRVSSSSARPPLHPIAKKRQKKGASAQAHPRKVQCPKDCFQWMNHKAASTPQTRECLRQRLEVEEAPRAPLPTLNIFSYFSRDEIGKLVEELCRTAWPSFCRCKSG